MQQRRLQDRGECQLQVAGRDGRVPILLRDHLALLGDLQFTVHGAERLGEDGGVGGPTSAADGPAPAMEQPQMYSVSLGGVPHRPLGLVDLPLRGGDPALLVGIGVAEHDLLAVAPELEDLSVGGIVEQGLQEPAGVAEVVDRLDQGHQADAGDASTKVDQAGLPGQNCRLEDVGRALGHRDDVRLDDLISIEVLGLPDGTESAEGEVCLWAESRGQAAQRAGALELG